MRGFPQSINTSITDAFIYVFFKENIYVLLSLFSFGHAKWHAGPQFPEPGIEPMPPTVEAWSPNHWTSKEIPLSFTLLTNFSYSIQSYKL